jgi:hypothetical protein
MGTQDLDEFKQIYFWSIHEKKGKLYKKKKENTSESIDVEEEVVVKKVHRKKVPQPKENTSESINDKEVVVKKVPRKKLPKENTSQSSDVEELVVKKTHRKKVPQPKENTSESIDDVSQLKVKLSQLKLSETNDEEESRVKHKKFESDQKLIPRVKRGRKQDTSGSDEEMEQVKQKRKNK